MVEALQVYVDLHLTRLPRRRGLAEAIRYTLGRWHALIRFLNDGWIDLDNNPMECTRPIGPGCQKQPVRGLRRRREPLGDRGSPSQDGQTRWRRAVRMAAPQPDDDDQ